MYNRFERCGALNVDTHVDNDYRQRQGEIPRLDAWFVSKANMNCKNKSKQKASSGKNYLGIHVNSTRNT